MSKVFIVFLGLFLVACSATQTANFNAPKVAFSPENNSEVIDNAYEPIILKYQDLLKGVMANDTAYLFTITRELIQLTDSLDKINYEQAPVTKDLFKMGLYNVNAELKGLLASETLTDIPMSMNMLSLQLLHALGQVGYKEKTIYIYSVSDKTINDGLLWLSQQKSMRDPYHREQKTILNADQVLQELK